MHIAPTLDTPSMQLALVANSFAQPSKMLLIRHGETEWSLSGRHTSFTEIELSTRGRSEAAALAPFLKPLNILQILMSPRKRARETCELAQLRPVAEVDPDLCEWNYGDYEGKTSIEICKARKEWNLFHDGCPNGESPDQVAHRADRLIGRIRTLEGSTAIFTHGQFGAVLGARWIGLPVSQARHFLLSTASVSVLGFDPHHLDTAVLELWNSRSQQMAMRTANDLPFAGSTAHER